MEIEGVLDKPVKPNVLLAAVNADRKILSPRQQVVGNAAKEWRECWIAGHLALSYERYAGPCEVIVRSGTYFPDFYLVTNGSVRVAFENTSILEDDRRMGDEYREIEEAVSQGGTWERHISEDDFRRNETRIPQAVRGAIETKALHYGRDVVNVNLCIYLNLFAEVDLGSVRAACAGLENTFASVWLLKGSRVATLFTSSQCPLTRVNEPGFGSIGE